MLGVAIGLVVIGAILGFIIFPAGFIVGIVGIVLLVLYLFGWGRRAAASGEPEP